MSTSFLLHPLRLGLISATFALLAGCQGSSNTFSPDTPTAGSNVAQQACTGTDCVTFQFLTDAPVTGLNYECGYVRNQTDNSGFGQCPDNTTMTAYLSDNEGKRRITLGSTLLKRIGSTFTDQAAAVQQSETQAQDLLISVTPWTLANISDQTEAPTVSSSPIPVNITRLLQSLRSGSYIDNEPVNLLDLKTDPNIKAAIASLPDDVTANDFSSDAYIEKTAPLLASLNRPLIDRATASERLAKVFTLLYAGYYSSNPLTVYSQPEPGTDNIISVNDDTNTLNITGRQLANPNNKALIGLGLIVDRDGYNIGQGVQYKAPLSQTSNKKSDISLPTMPVNVDFQKLVLVSKQLPFNPINGVLNTRQGNPLLFQVVDQQNNLLNDLFSLNQGQVQRYTALVGTNAAYRNINSLGASATAPTGVLGRWQSFATSGTTPTGSPTYEGIATLIRVQGPDSNFDRDVWRTANTVNPGETYSFPLHVKLTFRYSDGTANCQQNACVLGTQAISILPSGAIVTDMNEDCSAVDGNLVDAQGNPESRIGYVRTTLTNGAEQFISPVLMLAGKRFGALDGVEVATLGLGIANRVKLNVTGVDRGRNVNITDNTTQNSTSPATYLNLYEAIRTARVTQYAEDGKTETEASKQQRITAAIKSTGIVQAAVSSCYVPQRRS